MPDTCEPIAIVGVGVRIPGGNNSLADFADFLSAGRSGTGEIPADRWDIDAFGPDDREVGERILAAGGGFLNGVDQFDAKFFNISPKEAAYVDPQQRLVLETAWEALEDAGIDPCAPGHGNGGVYVALANFDYAVEMSSLPFDEMTYVGTGMAHSAASGRVSYFLGWRGPSISVDTACSSSLVALHLAATGLRLGECDIALCGGVNTIHSPLGHLWAAQTNVLAPDGRCKTFDDAADGYCRSEGCAMVVLKRLSDARRDGDRIIALVRGSAVGQDGASGALTVPNGAAQEAVMRAAISAARCEPKDIQYVEAHGTGTALGDPIEMGAIAAVFAGSREASDPVVVGSLKTNVGHMEPAAGIGGVVKTALQLRDSTIYPHVNFTRPSRYIPWDDYPVTIPTQALPWPGEPRRAVVNSFGVAGTIASVVLEQAPASTQPPVDVPDDPPHVFTLSAKSERSLRHQIGRYQQCLADNPDYRVADVCYTSNVGRNHFPIRLAGVVRDQQDLARLLDKRLSLPGGGFRKVAMLFTGGGSQYVGMGRPLYEQYPVFRRHIEDCDRLFEPAFGRSIKAMMLGDAADAEKIHQILYMQPALFALEYATAMLWLSWGITPNVLIGHSAGEIAAAAVAGLLTLPDAVTLVTARARLMHSARPGRMVAVEAAESEIVPLLEQHSDVSLAAVNGPRQCVVSGGPASIAAITQALDARRIRVKPLAVSCAAHSPLMAELADQFRQAIGGVGFHDPELTLVSNVTGQVARQGEMASADYWVRHLVDPVNFAAGMRAIEQRGNHVFVEVGPAMELIGMGKQCIAAQDHLWLGSLHPDDTDASMARGALAQVYAAGLPVCWAGYHQGRAGRKVSLPTYAFDRKRYWVKTPGRRAGASGRTWPHQPGHPLLGSEVSSPEQLQCGVREFAARLSADNPAYLADHAVMGRVVFAGAAYIEVLLAVQDAVYGETSRPIEDLRIAEALFLTDDHVTEMRTRLRSQPDGGATVEIVSLAAGSGEAIERCHATAAIGATPAGGSGGSSPQASTAPAPALADVAGELLTRAGSLAGRADAEYTADDLYADFADLGLTYGPAFTELSRVTRHGADLAIGELRGQDAAPPEHLPPALLDGALQTIAALADATDGIYMPVRFGHCQLIKKPRGRGLRSILRMTPGGGGKPGLADLVLLEHDVPVFVLSGIEVKRAAGACAQARNRMFHEPRWVKRSLRHTRRERPQVLVMHRGEEELADLAMRMGEAGAELYFAATTEEAARVLRVCPADVCWFWRAGEEAMDEAKLRAECESNYRDLLDMLRMLEREGFGRDQRLWLVTEGAQWLSGDQAGNGAQLPAASLWGFGHVLWAEYPSYKVTMVDLQAAASSYQPLLDEWLSGETAEFQIAYRAGSRHVRRVCHSGPDGEQGGNFELTIEEYGQLSNIRPVPADEVPPQGDQIQVRVHAAGLNFKDVLNALGLHKKWAQETGATYRPLPLGYECSGTVVAAGPDAAFQIGDEVVVAHLGCMKKLLTVSSAEAFSKPARIGFAEAAALPTAYLTAHYALHQLAQIRPGDRVLIHAAAGGVGQAAVQLAKRAGAEIFATASHRKWPLLRAQGIEHIMSSRTVEFADEVMRITGGSGVDIVLNSLNRDFIGAGMRILAPEGRFIELGRMGAWTQAEVREARPDVRYHNFDFSEFTGEDITGLLQSLGPVMDLVAAGDLQPIPTTAYALDEVEEAFGVLSRGANTGKLVISFVDNHVPAPQPIVISPDETYLITGGLGALGLLAAERLVSLGARHLALVSRRATPAADEAKLAARLGHEVRVSVYQADIGNSDDVGRIFSALKKEGTPPLGGIIHSAGVLADMPIAAQTADSIEAVFQSKVYGTWALHAAAASFPSLRFFVGYSSVAALFGPKAQSNYAAGSAFLDAVMLWRRAQGLPGMTVNWGAWADVGLAADLSERHIKAIEKQGFTMFKPSRGMRALVSLFGGPPAQIIIADVDWARHAASRPLANALYSQVAERVDAVSRIDLDTLLSQPKAERLAAINAFIRASVAAALHFDSAEEVAPDAKFFQIGMDSLVAVELKNGLESAFGIPLPTSIVFDYPAIDLLTDLVDDQLRPIHSGRQSWTLAATACFHAERRPDQRAVICEDRALTYSQLHAESNRTARALLAEGIRRGARVAFLGLESEHYYDLLFGCAKSATVLVPINWRLTAAEVDHILRDSGAELLFVEQAFVDVVEQVRSSASQLRGVVRIDGQEGLGAGFRAWKAGQPDSDLDTTASPDDPLVQIYTSGTTGLPKGVVLAQRSFFVVGDALASAGLDWIDWRPDDKSLIAIPGFHIGGLWWAIQGFNAGVTNVALRRFVSRTAVDVIQQHGITTTCVVPAMLAMMMDEPGVGPAEFSTLRKVVYGGSPISQTLLERCLAVIACDFAQIYGLTETGNTAVCLPPDCHVPGHQKLRAAGRPYPGIEVKIIGAEGTAEPGEVGQVCIRTPAHMVEYWGLPDATKETLVDGWLHTGDAGYLDRDGYLYICDRIKDMIIVAGENVYPAEIENALNKHPAVADAAVIGIPDERWGEAIQAFIVTRPGQQVTPRQFVLFLMDYVAAFKIPTRFDFIDAVPRNPSGKILRRLLREAYWSHRESKV